MPLPSIFPRISSVIPTAPSTNPATVTGGDGSSRAATFGNISSVDAAGCSAASVQATETAAGGSSGNNYDVEFYNEEGEDRRKGFSGLDDPGFSLSFCNNKDKEQNMFDEFISLVNPRKQEDDPTGNTQATPSLAASGSSRSRPILGGGGGVCPPPPATSYIEITVPESDRHKTNQKKLFYSSLGFGGRDRRLSTSPVGGRPEIARARRTSGSTELARARRTSGSPSSSSGGRISTSPSSKTGSWLFGSSPTSSTSPASSYSTFSNSRRTRISSGGRRNSSSSSMAGTPPSSTSSTWWAGPSPNTPSSSSTATSFEPTWGAQWTTSTWVPVRNTEMPGSLLAAGPPESVVQASDPVLQAHRTRPQDTEVPPQNSYLSYVEEEDMKSLYINKSKTEITQNNNNRSTEPSNIHHHHHYNHNSSTNSSGGGSLLRQQLQGKFAERKSTETVLCKECGNTLTVKCIMGTCLKSDQVLCRSCKRELTVKCILNSC